MNYRTRRIGLVGMLLLFALVMLVPIGGDTGDRTGPNGMQELDNYYWSAGTLFILGSISDSLRRLNALTISISILLISLAALWVYDTLRFFRNREQSTNPAH